MADRVTYVGSDNATTNSTNFEMRDEAAGSGLNQDTYVKKILFGNPADGDRTIIHDAQTQPGHASGMGSVATGEAVWNFTQGTAAAGIQRLFEVDFTANGSKGLFCKGGGSIHTNSSPLTVIWERAAEMN